MKNRTPEERKYGQLNYAVSEQLGARPKFRLFTNDAMRAHRKHDNGLRGLLIKAGLRKPFMSLPFEQQKALTLKQVRSGHR